MKAISKKKLMDHAFNVLKHCDKHIFDVVKSNIRKGHCIPHVTVPIAFNNIRSRLLEDINDNHLFNQDDYIFVEEE